MQRRLEGVRRDERQEAGLEDAVYSTWLSLCSPGSNEDEKEELTWKFFVVFIMTNVIIFT